MGGDASTVLHTSMVRVGRRLVWWVLSQYLGITSFLPGTTIKGSCVAVACQHGESVHRRCYTVHDQCNTLARSSTAYHAFLTCTVVTLRSTRLLPLLPLMARTSERHPSSCVCPCKLCIVRAAVLAADAELPGTAPQLFKRGWSTLSNVFAIERYKTQPAIKQNADESIH